jgi:putative endonuclease
VRLRAGAGLLRKARGWLGRPGSRGEDAACALLQRQGYEVLARNFRCRGGEIDIVAREGNTTVFVEVKERHGASHGSASDAVTCGKQRRVVHAARLFAAQRGLSESPIRFDVVAIDWDARGVVHVRHERSAFDSRAG